MATNHSLVLYDPQETSEEVKTARFRSNPGWGRVYDRLKKLIQDRARESARVQKVLEDAGVKLASVATDVLGVSC